MAPLPMRQSIPLTPICSPAGCARQATAMSSSPGRSTQTERFRLSATVPAPKRHRISPRLVTGFAAFTRTARSRSGPMLRARRSTMSFRERASPRRRSRARRRCCARRSPISPRSRSSICCCAPRAMPASQGPTRRMAAASSTSPMPSRRRARPRWREASPRCRSAPPRWSPRPRWATRGCAQCWAQWCSTAISAPTRSISRATCAAQWSRRDWRRH